jgi:hypothetical protein
MIFQNPSARSRECTIAFVHLAGEKFLCRVFHQHIQHMKGQRTEYPRTRPSDALFKMLLCLRQRAGGSMSEQAVEILITNAIHSAFIKYPEGDGGPNLDYEWIAPDQSAHIAKAILLELSASGYQIVKKAS